MMTSVAAAQGGDFYQARLAAGRDAYQQKRFPEAVDQFRIAAFGFLERPQLLSEALARLALVEEAAGHTQAADAALGRFLELERRFKAYGGVRLEPPVQGEFHALLLRRVSHDTLLSIPSLAGLVESEEQKLGKLPAKERRKALEEEQRREPGNVRWAVALAKEAAARSDHRDAVKWSTRALEIDARSTEALALRAHARAARAEFAEALADLKALPPEALAARPELLADRFVSLAEGGDRAAAEAALRDVPAGLLSRSDVARAQRKLAAGRDRERQPSEEPSGARSGTDGDSSAFGTAGAAPRSAPAAGGPVDVLAESRRLVKGGRAGEAERILLAALESEPGHRGLRLALLEASCLSRSWQRAAAQIPLVSPFSEEEVAPMFYAAVVLYETGRAEEARGYLQRALPRVSGPLVDEYTRKILGRS